MKPCLKYRKKIAWLAINALDASQEMDLRTHLEECPVCRAYWKEMSALSRKLSSAQPRGSFEASEEFHQRVVRAVRHESRNPIDRRFPRWPFLAWRVALPVAGLCAIVIAVLSPGPWRRPTLQTPPVTPSGAVTRIDLEPTVSNYQMVANDSLDKLDELLKSQGNHNPPLTPRFPGPTLAGANTLE